MEKQYNQEILEKVDALIDCIMRSDMYQQHLLIRKKLEQNPSLMKKIEDIKALEKTYVRSHFTEEDVKKKIDQQMDELKQIPLYKSYEQSLEEINDLLTMLNQGLNDTFDDLLNR